MVCFPSGPAATDPPANGNDPGHHNRSIENWTTRSGHYGHCHVPGNVHWDPAYTRQEADFVMSIGAAAPQAFTLRNMAKRIAAVGDVWEGMLRERQSLGKAAQLLKG